jgi:hypothetical protein
LNIISNNNTIYEKIESKCYKELIPNKAEPYSHVIRMERMVHQSNIIHNVIQESIMRKQVEKRFESYKD